MIKAMGLAAEIDLRQAGWYPRGGGEIRGKISLVGHQGLSPCTIRQRGRLRRVTVSALISNLPDQIAQRECQAAASRLRHEVGIDPVLKICSLG
jgi:RNA 3'-terminal phosphate cyclase